MCLVKINLTFCIINSKINYNDENSQYIYQMCSNRNYIINFPSKYLMITGNTFVFVYYY